MLARDWLNTYYLEDTGLFRVSLDHDRLGLKGGEGLPLQQLHILRRLTNDRFLAIDLRASTEAAG